MPVPRLCCHSCAIPTVIFFLFYFFFVAASTITLPYWYKDLYYRFFFFFFFFFSFSFYFIIFVCVCVLCNRYYPFESLICFPIVSCAIYVVPMVSLPLVGKVIN